MSNARFNPTRLVLARRRRGLTRIALARLAGVGNRTLYNIETGIAEPATDTLAALSSALKVPVEFFTGPDVEQPTPEAASFRALRSMNAKIRDSALAAGAIAFDLSRWIDQRYQLPASDLPDLRDYEPEAAAEAVRDAWGIGQRPIGNMVHLLESRGVRVFSLSEDRRVDAFSLWHRELPFVFLNTVKTAEHSRMDAAHELGHLVLHRHGVPWGRNVEREAQAFAAALLMPRASVLAAPRLHAPTLQHVVQLKKRWLVSAAALVHRLHALGMLSDWSYRGLCIQLAKYGRTREPEGIPKERSQVLEKVFGPGQSSRAEAAKDLCLHIPDLEALIFGLRAEPRTLTSPPATPSQSPAVRSLRLVGKGRH